MNRNTKRVAENFFSQFTEQISTSLILHLLSKTFEIHILEQIVSNFLRKYSTNLKINNLRITESMVNKPVYKIYFTFDWAKAFPALTLLHLSIYFSANLLHY